MKDSKSAESTTSGYRQLLSNVIVISESQVSNLILQLLSQGPTAITLNISFVPDWSAVFERSMGLTSVFTLASVKRLLTTFTLLSEYSWEILVLPDPIGTGQTESPKQSDEEDSSSIPQPQALTFLDLSPTNLEILKISLPKLTTGSMTTEPKNESAGETKPTSSSKPTTPTPTACSRCCK